MRTKNYLWAVLAAATLSLDACVSGENEIIEPQNPTKMEARLELTLKGAPANTRSTGAALPTTANEEKISRVAVAIFDKDGKVLIIREFAKTEEKYTVNCAAGENCTGIVVVNAPEKHFAGIDTKTNFRKKLITLSQDATALPMSGDIKSGSGDAATTTFTLQAGKTSTLSAEVSRLVARVSISSIKTDFDASGQYAKATFKLKKVFLHKTQSTYPADPKTPTDQPFNANLKTGWWDSSVTSTHEDKLADEVGGSTGTAITATPYTTPYWFYAFPNGNTNSTRLVLFGSFDPDGEPAAGVPANKAAEDVYYPIVVNKLQTGTTINDGTSNVTSAVAGKGDGTLARNTTYAITATIKGKGADSPDADMNPATLTLTVEVAGWALNIKQDVEFN